MIVTEGRLVIQLDADLTDTELSGMVRLMVATAQRFINEEFTVSVYYRGGKSVQHSIAQRGTVSMMSTRMVWRDGRYLGNQFTIDEGLATIPVRDFQWRGG